MKAMFTKIIVNTDTVTDQVQEYILADGTRLKGYIDQRVTPKADLYLTLTESAKVPLPSKKTEELLPGTILGIENETKKIYFVDPNTQQPMMQELPTGETIPVAGKVLYYVETGQVWDIHPDAGTFVSINTLLGEFRVTKASWSERGKLERVSFRINDEEGYWETTDISLGKLEIKEVGLLIFLDDDTMEAFVFGSVSYNGQVIRENNERSQLYIKFNRNGEIVDPDSKRTDKNKVRSSEVLGLEN